MFLDLIPDLVILSASCGGPPPPLPSHGHHHHAPCSTFLLPKMKERMDISKALFFKELL